MLGKVIARLRLVIFVFGSVVQFNKTISFSFPEY
jgi:hypothetical protein